MNLIREEMPGLHQALCDYLGDTIVYTPTVGAPVAITATVADPSNEGDQPLQTAAVFRFRLSDLPFTPGIRGDTITFDGKTYKVESIQTDQYGWTTAACSK